MSPDDATAAPAPELPEEPADPADVSESRSLADRADSMAERFGKSDWIELAATLLLALATIASAWSAYQATRWGGVQANAYSQAGATRSESVRASNEALAQTQVDVATFIGWLDAYASERPILKAFYEDRFRAEFKPAFQAWLNSVPAGSIPDGAPFSRPEYQLAAQQQADKLLADAEAFAAEARAANQTGDNFILVAVLMASVLFFAGVGTKFKGTVTRRTMISMAAVVFVIGLVVIASLPQNVGV
jgi:protein-S-isoprenylcysteine O-methyltransferase Ste14